MRQPIRVDNSRPVSVYDTARTLGVSKKRAEAIIREVERTAGRFRNGSEARFERLAELPKIDLHPIIPSLEVLAEKADFINRTLREAAVKDEYRPACVGAIMLAMWK